ncbi:UDP-glucose/GDP-mannose dehydrogenase family protein [Candidatus Woesearchaeota archaeon]|nr:UDP-glucose/GDP-mannose dehydrogenase family protein [Candidatus Woesearchaeota archaeon]
MDVAVIGTGYVGLVTGALLAKYGNKVICVDNDPRKVEMLQNGQIPIYEEGLDEIVKDSSADGRLSFTGDLCSAVSGSDVSFIAVGTPVSEEGSFDMRFVRGVAHEIGQALRQNGRYHVITMKSTVPPGTHAIVKAIIGSQLAGADHPSEFDVVSNPEFLKEGRAVRDFESPDRIIIGADAERATKMMEDLYSPFARRRQKLLVMRPVEAELAKLASNVFLATKVSYMNELARICDLFGADVMAVREGMVRDERIGSHFMLPGPGFGGGCFPKDLDGLITAVSNASGGKFVPAVAQATRSANLAQKEYFSRKIVDYYGGDDGVCGKNLAMWGLAFKANTDDVRDSPALYTLEYLLKRRAVMHVHDPKAMDNVKRYLGDSSSRVGFCNKVVFCDKKYAAVEGADGLIVMTEWPQYRTVDFDELRTMRTKVIFDGRNLLSSPEKVKAEGFEYFGIGRC